MKISLKKKALKNRALVFDGQSMRFEDWNGHLRVRNTNLTKANVCEYYGFEINNHKNYGLEPDRKYRFLRAPEALEKAVDSFRERPILYLHKAADADKLDNSKVIGTTGSDPSFLYPYIQSSITIWDGDYIQAIKEDRQAELSASYAFTPVMQQGEFEGDAYDGIMTDIYVDHVALVEEGRAGHDVRVADERLNRNMQKLNDAGRRLASALTDLLNQGNTEKPVGYDQVADAVASVSGVRRQQMGNLLKAVLSDCSATSDCPMVRDCPADLPSRISALIQKLSGQDQAEDAVYDETPFHTLQAADEGENAAGDVDDSQNGNAGNGQVGEWVKAADAAILERAIEKRIMAKAQQAQEARMLVKPLVGEWAVTEDSGAEILRSVLTQMTGKMAPLSMKYDHLKYAVDMLLSQKKQGRTNDAGMMHASDLQRFGAKRLRSI